MIGSDLVDEDKDEESEEGYAESEGKSEEEDYEEGSRCRLVPNWKLNLKLKLGLEPELVLMSVSSETTSEGALSGTLKVGDNLLRLGLAGRQANLWRRNGILYK